jgi:D-alanyl-D-alanine carboxypeptidase (penicillin-binding protein 5/6)
VTVYGTVLGSDTRGARNEALRALLGFGLGQYGRVQAIDRGRTYATAETGYGQPDVDLVASRPSVVAHRKGKPLVERIVAPTALALPVAKGQTVGRVEVYDGDRLVASSNLVTARAVAEAGFLAKVRWYTTETVRNAWEIVS